MADHSVDVHVSSVNDLFREPETDPLRGRFHEMSGIDRLIEHLASISGPPPTQLLLHVADTGEIRYSPDQIRTAISGYCAARMAGLDRERAAIGRQGRQELIFGVAVLSALLLLAAAIESVLPESADAWQMILPEGLVIVAWIALWNPVDKLLFNRWPLQREKSHLQHIANMTVETRCQDDANE